MILSTFTPSCMMTDKASIVAQSKWSQTMNEEVNFSTLENSPNQNTEKPFSRNLFDYATSELSQDAFIRWICAQFDSNDAAVRTASQNLLHAFLESKDNDPVEVKEIYRQKENIDILLLLQHEGQEFSIVVEDKTSSQYHDDQLNKYRTSAAGIYDREENDIRVVYFKTETVHEEQDIRDKCDIVLNRKDILECLNTTSKNPILMDYVDRLKRICARYDQYRSLPVKDWSYDGWCGFFEHLQKRLITRGYWTGYGYNNNLKGGHWTLWLGNSKKIGVGAWQFMVNVETPNSHVFDQDECLLKVTVRLCNNKGKHSRKEFDLPEINRRKYRHVCGVNTIMGELMRIDRSSKESSWKYEGVEKAIFDAIDQYEKWCDENLYAGTD